MKHHFKKFIYFFFIFLFLIISHILIFKNILFSNSVIVSFSIHPFNICEKYSNFWNTFKKISFFSLCVSSLITSYYTFSLCCSIQNKLFIHNNKKSKKIIHKTEIKYPQLELFVGIDEEQNPVYIPQNGLFQNVLVTGTIGSGKTSSLLYPALEQIISYKSTSEKSKISMLILDVKGNFYSQVLKYAKNFGRLGDVILIELNGKYTYNPLDKPMLKPQILANRLSTILSLFSNNNSDSYWIDKSEQILTECIKLCRLYNNGYVTFEELHKLIMNKSHYDSKIAYLKKLFLEKKLSHSQVLTFSSAIDFFENEYFSLDGRVLSILKSEISRITNVFVSDAEVKNTFSPPNNSCSFSSFDKVLEDGKIVVLKMNISEYSSLSKIIAAYLKLDFQTEVLMQLSKKNPDDIRISCFLSDEYHEYVTKSDSNFFAQSREAKCINILATQSYTSLLNTLKSESDTKVIIQNLVNKFWFRTDDTFTIEDAQKQIGKAEKTYSSNTISENAKETSFNPFTKTFLSRDTNISESINTYSQLELIYDTNFFTQELETFSCLSFISTGNRILPPKKLTTIPYFRKEI